MPPSAASAPISNEQADESAKGTLDKWLGEFSSSALTNARASGKTFPLYNIWLVSISAAVRQGMSPTKLAKVPGSGTPLNKDAQGLIDEASLAETEIAEFIPPPLSGHDIQKIAAFKERTHPKSLNKVLLMAFQGEAQGVRNAAADRLNADYTLPK